MEKKGEALVVGLVILLVAAIVGLIIISFMQDERTQTPVLDDTFTASNTSFTVVSPLCIVPGTISYENASTNATIAAGNFTLDDGSVRLDINLPGTVLHGDSVNASYTERSCNYQTGVTGSMLSYTGLMVAIVLFAFAAAKVRGQ